MESTKNTEGRPALRPHQEHLIKIAVDGYKAGRDNAKFMGISVPTAAGKTFILPYLFDELRKLDPEVKFIIATSQNGLIQDIIQHFLAHGGIKVLHIRGTENQIRAVADDAGQLNKANVACCQYIRKASSIAPSDNPEREQAETPETEFQRRIGNAMSEVQAIEAVEQVRNPSRFAKHVREDLLEKQRSELCNNYIRAERIVEKALRVIARREAELRHRMEKIKRLKKAKKHRVPVYTYSSIHRGETKERRRKKEKEIKVLAGKCYLEQLRSLPKEVSWLFPDFSYELADVVVLTHAKINYSILTKRKMKLSDISYDREGCHIVYISDETENWRENYVQRVVEQAVRNEADLLPFLNLIYNVLQGGFFDDPDYAKISIAGDTSIGTGERAAKLKQNFEIFMEKYGYVFNMHMADIDNKEKKPEITNSPGYIISKASALRYIEADKKSQTMALVKNRKAPSQMERAVEESAETHALINFVADASSLIRQYIGVVRGAAGSLNRLRHMRGEYEDFTDSAASVVYRTFGDKHSSASRYVINNVYHQFGAKYDDSEEKNQYRYDLSYTSVRAGTPYGGDVSLRHASTGRFPEAELEDTITNVRFTYLVSGTGWLNALNNNNMAYLDQKCGQYHPLDMEIKALHDAYMEWKGAQYEHAGTRFIVERLKSNGQIKQHEEKDNEIVCLFIVNHMKYTAEHGMDGGTGAFIFPPRKLDDYIRDIYFALEKKGVNTSRIALLTLQKGKMRGFNPDGSIRDLEERECEVIGDTFNIDTSDGRYYYVITAHRSGTRGYNIAFRNRYGVYDASGVCLFELTNIIEQKPNPKKTKTDMPASDPSVDAMENTARILRTNMACMHCMLLRDGQISAEALTRMAWLIRKISYDMDILGKDLYPEDPWSPYKLQGLAECLQALGRLRNNKKPPAMYIALSNGLFRKQFILEDQLQPDYLSYEATQVYRHLPRLWRAFEEENAGLISAFVPDENKLVQSWRSIIKTKIPKAKKRAAEDPSCLKELEELVKYFNDAKQRAISLNIDAVDRYKRKELPEQPVRMDIFLANRRLRKPSEQDNDYIPAFAYLSRYNSAEGRTEYENDWKDGLVYMTPGSLLIPETAALFSVFCGNAMKRNLPAVMNPNILKKMKEADRFPYAPSKFGYDILAGEYGERLFLSVMEEANARGMTGLTVTAMPLLQYEDYDFSLCRDGKTVGYVNVKYRKVTEFLLEKDLRLYSEKLSRSPLTGTVRILYINMRPAGERTANVFTENNNESVRRVNKELCKYGKTIELFALSPFVIQDIYNDAQMFTEKISTHMIKQLNSFFS